MICIQKLKPNGAGVEGNDRGEREEGAFIKGELS
jgi:hypothetical protein